MQIWAPLYNLIAVAQYAFICLNTSSSMPDLRRSAIYSVTIVYTAALIIASLIPSPGVPTAGGLDKAEHFLAYLVLAFLVSLSLEGKREGILIPFLFGTALGTLLELMQGMGGARSCSSWDAVADSLGSLAGALIFRLKSGHNL